MELRIPQAPFVELAMDIAKSFSPIDDKDKVYKILVLHLFNKAWRTFDSIHLLCVNRYGQEASILLRSFLEVVVNAVYISKAPAQRAILFAEYGFLEKIKFRRAVVEYQKANPSDAWIERIVSSCSARDLEDDTKEYERVKGNYPRRDSWSGKSIKGMAMEAGMHLHYILYKMFCNVTHMSSKGTTSYFIVKSGTIEFTADKEDDINARWHTACVYFYSIMGLVNETFGLRFDDRLKTLSDILLERETLSASSASGE